MTDIIDVYDVITLGHPTLREKAKDVQSIEEVREICHKLVRTLRNLKGAALAAPQVDKSIRAFVVEIKKTELFPDREETPLYTVVNPEILEYSSEKEYGWESCFSMSGLIGLVPRAKSIKMKYLDIDGNEHIETFNGYVARVMQHEYDHLDGIMYIDKVENTKDIYMVENWKKYVLKRV